ncbi:hypothetical protein [Streptomyces litchfieldiae]|uniref:Uncharacterized protein n=1 Tax=Streptomyces litchfieldiae TaxID=3075543 RepID=A0ABU2MNM3_9ACTN|nr:hypothetical protein [Streptomyces sp. DSM 44938]MDT0343222.1 hypothetical protein [Streptomyces sp. DSM 44938]
MLVHFDVPLGFSSMPMGMSMEQSQLYLRERLRDAGEMAAEIEPQAARRIHDISHLLNQAGVIYAGGSLGRVGDQPSVATLLITAQNFSYGSDTRIAAEGAMLAFTAARGKDWTGQVYDLPCGPAALAMGIRAQPLPPPEESADPAYAPVAELHAFVPVPDHATAADQYMLTATFTTPSVQHWEVYMPPMVELLRSITFEEQAKATCPSTSS